MPLGCHAGRIALLAEPDEATGSVERDADLSEHRRQHVVDVAVRPELERDVRDQPLALEGVGQRDRRARTLERQPAFADEGLHLAKLLVVEHTRVANRAEDDPDHLVRGTNRDIDAALDLRDRVQTLVDDRGVFGIVDRERPSLTDGRVDPGRLAVERDSLADQPEVVLTAFAGSDDHRRQAVVLDQGHVGEVELEGRGELVEEHLRNVGRLGGVEELL